ncbi:DUF6562 domain-containing protein [uncultured Prevotella sp.]|uniref:DUF6562 domain-containing protein n=1 Tax=uncultured Prevotella sp. TaxID=159272 RepID=UPI002636F369|nr:DUF6562 domain-containing protein [uncultured Prevotella sp.]
MKTIRLYLYIIMCTLSAIAFTACDKDAHDDEYPLGDGQGAFIVGLVSEQPVSNLNVFLFGSEGSTVVRKDYADPRALASEYLPVAADSYTLVVVANVTDNDLPAQTTVADLTGWLDEHAADRPDMLTASIQTSVAAGEVKRLVLGLQGGTAGIGLTDLTLRLTVPGKEMPDHVTRSGADGGRSLRLVAEVYLKDSETRVHRRTQLCTPQTDGTYTATLDLQPGDYDLRLWADWTDGTTADKYYRADDLTSVTVLTDGYVANGETDGKDAYYASLSLTVPEAPSCLSPKGEVPTAGSRTGEGNISSPTGGVEGAVTLLRPLARYRIVATDVEGYNNLIAKGEALPPIEELEASVSYEGFLPTAFNVATGQPNDALQGIAYRAGIVAADGFAGDEARQVGADFVLAGDDDSFVTVTVHLTDRTTGETVSTVRGVKIPYRRGELTTVSGTFLTAGRTSGGVEIDTDWGEDIVIEF